MAATREAASLAPRRVAMLTPFRIQAIDRLAPKLVVLNGRRALEIAGIVAFAANVAVDARK